MSPLLILRLMRRSTAGMLLAGLWLFLTAKEGSSAEVVGKVADARTGESLVGAVVRAIPVGRNQRELQATSGFDGRYQLDLPRGKYRLFVSSPGSDYLSQFYSASGNADGDIIDVAAFHSFRIIDVSLALGGSIGGTVLRAVDEAPIAGMRLRATSRTFRASTETRADGSYRFRALPPGDYRIQAQPLEENFIAMYYGGVRDVEKAPVIPLARSQRIAHIDFRLHYGGIISGRVFANKNREPLAGMRVLAEGPDRQEPPYFTFTDSQGFYSLRGLSEGSYIVEASASRETSAIRGRKSFLLQFHRGRFDRALAEKLEIEPGTTFTGIDFAMVEGASLSGTVRSRYHNRPLPDVSLVTQDDDRVSLNPFQGVTDADGNFSITDLPPGEYWVLTSLPTRIRRLVNLFYRDKLSQEKADRVPLEDGDRIRHVDFSLPLGATIRGTFEVDDEEYAWRTAGKSVTLQRQGTDLEGFGKQNFKLKNDGSFLIDRAPPGRYTISPVLDDPNLVPQAAAREKTVEVAEGDLIEDVHFPLRLVGSISGKITTQNQTFPLDKLVLMLVNLKDNSRSYFELPSENYTIPGIEPGKYFMVLLTKPDPTPSTGLPGGQVFDMKVIEVARGRTTPGANLQVRSEPDFKPRLFP